VKCYVNIQYLLIVWSSKKGEGKTSASDPNQLWINIGSAFNWLLDPDPHADPDPEGVIPAESKTENKNEAKRMNKSMYL
jgi:hypothetical protein